MANVTVMTTSDASNGARAAILCTLRDPLEHTSDPQNGTFVSVPSGMAGHSHLSRPPNKRR